MGCCCTKENGRRPHLVELPDSTKPMNWPAGVKIGRFNILNWAETTEGNAMWIATPKTEQEIEDICNWAVDADFWVRAIGVGHNWSPLMITNLQSPTDVVLVDLKPHFNKLLGVDAATKGARVQLGMRQLDFLTALEGAGYGLVHTPAPDSITVGGMITIGGHGTAIPNPCEAPVGGFGSYSNRILSVRAVVFDAAANKYKIRDIPRADPAFGATLLTHLGRALLIEATILATPNYNMYCESVLDVKAEVYFAEPTAENPLPEGSMAALIEKCGRAEAIMFPFSEFPWMKTWTVMSEAPKGARVVNQALNYPFSDEYPPFITDLFQAALGNEVSLRKMLGDIKDWVKESENWFDGTLRAVAGFVVAIVTQVVDGVVNSGALTPTIGKMMSLITAVGMKKNNAARLYGPSKNTLIYVRDTTLQVTANGYAVMMKRKDLQRGIYEFYKIYKDLVEEFRARDLYPANGPLEIRVTGLDNPADTGVTGAAAPALSALALDQAAIDNGWDIALYLDILSMPGTPGANEFYQMMEERIVANPWFSGTNGRVRPEWSKGWAYTAANGAWTNQDFIRHTKAQLPEWAATMQRFTELDPKNIFSNPWLQKFLD